MNTETEYKTDILLNKLTTKKKEKNKVSWEKEYTNSQKLISTTW